MPDSIDGKLEKDPQMENFEPLQLSKRFLENQNETSEELGEKMYKEMNQTMEQKAENIIDNDGFI